MKCNDVQKILEIYSLEAIPNNIKKEILNHIQNCEECREYLNSIILTKKAFGKLKKIQYEQYNLIKKDPRQFNNEIWAKIRTYKKTSEHFPFIWGEIICACIILFALLISPNLISKEIIKFISIVLMSLGTIYTNYKEVKYDEKI